MTKKRYDWTKLGNGWVRYDARIGKSQHSEMLIYVYDDGDVWTYEGNGSPERTLELLTEAVAQRKQCEVREPRFKFGDWVRTPLGSRQRVVHAGSRAYHTLSCGSTIVSVYVESELTPCDPPDGGGE